MKETDFHDEVEHIHASFERLLQTISNSRKEQLDNKRIKKRVLESFNQRQKDLEKYAISYFEVG